MLGHRGCRLSITYPEILVMQVTAIVEATIACKRKHVDARPEIMIPLIATGKELTLLRNLTEQTIESVRKHKLAHWDRNRESNRAWLGLNMMTEGRAGFRAFHEGSKACREADFLLLRRRLAEGSVWGEELVEEVLEKAHGKEMAH